MIALIPVLFAIVGALVYGLSANGKVAELGRLIFACAFLALMLGTADHSIKLF